MLIQKKLLLVNHRLAVQTQYARNIIQLVLVLVSLIILEIHMKDVDLNVQLIQTVCQASLVSVINVKIHALEHVDQSLFVR